MALTTGIILIIVFFVLLLLGIPIAISMAISSVAAMFTIFPFDISIVNGTQKMFTGLDSFTMLALPFFILSGVIMNNGGIALKLINFARLFSGKLPGSLDHTNVVANMLFGSISGSSVAAAAAVGGVMSPLQEKEGYHRAQSAATNIASAPSGLLIPPSNTLIVYSLASGGTSIAALFIAGYIPGILWGLGIMTVAYIYAKKMKYPVSGGISLGQALKVFLDAIPSLLLIVVVIGGIVFGIFTATEGSAIAVLYSVILSMCYRTINFRKFGKMLLDSIEIMSVIMILIATSEILSFVMSIADIPETISSLLTGVSENPIVILLLMLIVLLIVGTFMDVAPAVLIFTPIFLPIVQELGMDPVQFGIILTMSLCIGNITPPVGSALFVGVSVAKLKIEQVIKPLLPFYGACFIMLLLVTYIPQISMVLPKLFNL